jgi:hypothetical protein
MPNQSSLDNALAVPDIVDSFRTNFIVPNLPGGGNYHSLHMLNTGLALPQVRIGHIRVPLFTHVVAFRGHRDHGNTFNISFYENAMGDVQSTILSWMERCSHSGDDTSLRKSGYAVPARVEALDTTGEVAYAFQLTNVWPQSITPPPDTDSSAPARIEVVFSVDFIDLVMVGGGSSALRAVRALARSRGVNLPSPGSSMDEDNPFLSEFKALTSSTLFDQKSRSPNSVLPQGNRTDTIGSGMRIDVKMAEVGLILGSSNGNV